MQRYQQLLETLKVISQTVGRYFWDGGILSNTPLRELVQSHQDYWLNTTGKGKDDAKIPDQDIYIVDVWPTEKKVVSMDQDEVMDRYFDLVLNYKTDYNEKVANFVSDYIDFVQKTKDIALHAIDAITDIIKRKNLKYNLGTILKTQAKSRHRNREQRTYENLLNGRFNTNVTLIDRLEDVNDIPSKLFDYSKNTINKLDRRVVMIPKGIFKDKDKFFLLEN